MNIAREDRSSIKSEREAVAFTPSEKARIKAASKAKYITKSTYIRLAVLEKLKRDKF